MDAAAHTLATPEAANTNYEAMHVYSDAQRNGNDHATNCFVPKHAYETCPHIQLGYDAGKRPAP